MSGRPSARGHTRRGADRRYGLDSGGVPGGQPVAGLSPDDYQNGEDGGDDKHAANLGPGRLRTGTLQNLEAWARL